MAASIRGKIASGAGWIFSTRLVVNLLGLVSSFVLARLLTPEDFGLVATAIAIRAVVSSVVALSPGLALIRLPRIGRSHLNTAWTLSILRSCLVALALSAAAYPVGMIYDDQRLFLILLVISADALVSGFANPALIVLEKRITFWQLFVRQAAEKLSSLTVALLIAFLTGSYWALVLGGLAASVVSVALSFAILPYRPAFSLKRFGTIWSFTQWLSFIEVLKTASNQLEFFLIPAFFSTAALGKYSFGRQIAQLPVQEVVGPIARTLFPAFSMFGGDRKQLRRVFLETQQLFFFLSLPAGVGVALVAKPLVALFLGEQWIGTELVIQVLSPILAVEVLAGPARQVLMALGETRALFGIALKNMLLKVPLMFVGIYFFGLYGLLAALGFAGLVWTARMAIVSAEELDISLSVQLRYLARTAISAAIMAVAVLALQAEIVVAAPSDVDRAVSLAASVAAGVVVYLGCHWLLWLRGGRPVGPEQTILNQVRQLRQKTT